jgi:hypothetical protein
MKKILLVLTILGLGFTSCHSNNPKLEYNLTVSGDVNVLDSTIVTKVYRVFSNLPKDFEVIQNDSVVTEFGDYIQSDEIISDELIKELIGIPEDVLAYYIYVVGYIIEPNTGLKLEVDKSFSLNWDDQPLPDKPL